MAGGWFEAKQVIGALALRGLFRARDLQGTGIPRVWLAHCEEFGVVVRHGQGVWGHPHFVPDAYELIQVRHPRAVFVLETALWLQGLLHEEPHIVVGIGMTDRRPVRAGTAFEAVRFADLSKESGVLSRPGRPIGLRVQSPSRAERELRRLHREAGPRPSRGDLPWVRRTANPPPPPPPLPRSADGKGPSPRRRLPRLRSPLLDALPDPLPFGW